MSGKDALSVTCPSCGAEVGERCWSGTRSGHKLARGSHRDRVRLAAGQHVPESFQRILRREIRRVESEIMSRKKNNS